MSPPNRIPPNESRPSTAFFVFSLRISPPPVPISVAHPLTAPDGTIPPVRTHFLLNSLATGPRPSAPSLHPRAEHDAVALRLRVRLRASLRSIGKGRRREAGVLFVELERIRSIYRGRHVLFVEAERIRVISTLRAGVRAVFHFVALFTKRA